MIRSKSASQRFDALRRRYESTHGGPMTQDDCLEELRRQLRTPHDIRVPRILLVEEDPAAGKLLQESLAKRFLVEVEVAENDEEALILLGGAYDRFDLIVIDQQPHRRIRRLLENQAKAPDLVTVQRPWSLQGLGMEIARGILAAA